MSYNEKTFGPGESINMISGSKIKDDGTQASHIADIDTDLKTDYANTDIDDDGTIDGTELAVVLNAQNTRINALATALNSALAVLEGIGATATS